MLENKEIFTLTPLEASQSKIPVDVVQVYGKRWLILILFSLFTISNFIQLMQYVVVADVMVEYYQESYATVDWTVLLPSLLYVVFTLPGIYTMEKVGLRKTIIISAIGTSIGSWVKLGSVHPDRFWVAILGQGIVSAFQVSIISNIARVAATWFGYNQIATASALAYIGIQVGTSLSFLLPPLAIMQGEKEDIERGLYIITAAYIAFSTILVPLIILLFSEKPVQSPSFAQHSYINTRETTSKNFFSECKTIISNKNYLIFTFIYGINSGSINGGIQNLTNQIILNYYPDAALDVGIIGLLHVGSSIVGSISCSLLLDKYKKFREFVYVLFGSLILSLVLFATTLKLGILFVYLSLVVLGFVLGAILPVSVEVMVELTYPQSQTVAVGFAGAWFQTSIVIFTVLYGYIHRNINNDWANITLISIVVIVNLLLVFVKFNLRRKTRELEMS